VGERAKPAVADQQVADAEQRVQHPRLRLLVRIEREGQHLHDQAGERVEQPEHFGHGKAASFPATRGLSEGLLA
jgi:hypothetical protein